MIGGKNGFNVFMLFLVVLVIGGFIYYNRDMLKQELDKNIEQVMEEQEQMKELQKAMGGIGGKLVYLEGAVEYKSIGGEWTRAAQDLDLYQGFAVEILGAGKVIINLDDGSAIRLNDNTGITFTSMEPDNIVITNDKGDLYSRVAQADRTFEVAVDDVFYQAVGTSYRVLNKETQKGIEVYHNDVKVKKPNNEIVLIEEGKKYYTKNETKPEEENTVVVLDKEVVEKDTFVMWNKEKDQEVEEYKDKLGFLAEETEEGDADEELEEDTKDSVDATPKTGLTLSGKVIDSGITFSWTVSGVEITKGYKLVKSTSSNPVYPGDKYQYITNPDQKSHTWKLTDGTTYYFRVCQYLGGKCGVYSNNLKLTAPTCKTCNKSDDTKDTQDTKDTSSVVKSLKLSASGTSVSWKVDGYSNLGFKVVWSKTSGPTYPTRKADKYKYLTSPDSRSTSLDAFDGAGTYFVRVCEYLGGKCGLYSNEVTVSLGEEKVSAKVNSLSLSGAGASVSWTIDGYSEKGFKVVYSKKSGPTYPLRSGDKYNYETSSEARSSTLKAFDGEGEYFVRVCEYLGGKCGLYSNEIQVTL